MVKLEKWFNVQEDGKEEANNSWWSQLIWFCFESRCMEIHVKMEKFLSSGGTYAAKVSIYCYYKETDNATSSIGVEVIIQFL